MSRIKRLFNGLNKTKSLKIIWMDSYDYVLNFGIVSHRISVVLYISYDKLTSWINSSLKPN